MTAYKLKTDLGGACSALALLIVLLGGSAVAAVSAQDAAKLGGAELTPVGAQQAGTEGGEIPAWSMQQPELTAAVSALQPGDFYPDLFKDEKPLMHIDHDNYAQYAEHLTAGQVAMLKRYPEYYLNVYPTHRTALYPDVVYAATKANATTAELGGLDTLKGAHAGFPFPIPQNGAQVIWNHKVRYRGNSVQQSGNIISVAQDGGYQVSGFDQTVKLFYGNTEDTKAQKSDVILKLLRHTTSPARFAGRYTLIIDRLDGGRDAWLYSPGQKRVIRAPTIQFDSPIAGSDGLIAADQSDMFNGSMKQYHWQLIGKQKIYIPYNDFGLQRPDHKYSELIQPGHMNPQYQRYELHRVWVVEATLKQGEGNQIHRRKFYVDEDSWTIAAVDCYDARGQLWQYQEGHIFPLLRNKVVFPAPTIVYSLNSGRYAIQNLVGEQSYFAKFDVPIPRAYFTPQNLKRIGGD